MDDVIDLSVLLRRHCNSCNVRRMCYVPRFNSRNDANPSSNVRT